MLFHFMGTLATDLKIEGSHFVQLVIINFLLDHRPALGSIWSVCLSINVWLRGWKSNSGLICTGWLGFDEQQFHFCFPLLKKKMPLLQEDQQQQALHCMSMLAPITSYWLKYSDHWLCNKTMKIMHSFGLQFHERGILVQGCFKQF